MTAERIHELLNQLHAALLDLHKGLVDSEKADWEQHRGSVGTPGQFLNMLLNEPAFAWMRPFSGLIVAIDVQLSPKQPMEKSQLEKEARQLFGIARNMLRPPEVVESRYREVLQRDTGVVLLHSKVIQVLNAAEAEGL